MKLIVSRFTRAPVAYVPIELHEILQPLGEEIQKIEEPKAEALLRTAAEVLAGVDLAVAHYKERARQLNASKVKNKLAA